LRTRKIRRRLTAYALRPGPHHGRPSKERLRYRAMTCSTWRTVNRSFLAILGQENPCSFSSSIWGSSLLVVMRRSAETSRMRWLISSVVRVRERRVPARLSLCTPRPGEFMYRRYAAGSELLAQTAACTRLEPRLALRGISCHSKAHGPARALKPRVEPGVRRTPFPTPPVASRHALSFGRQTAGRRSRRGLRNRRLGVRALYTDNDRKPACAYAYAYAYSAACMRPDATGCDEKGLIPEDAIRARRTLEAPSRTGLPA
jgi:hypothetical protein